jgi:glycosyltransferase involved in cell wall biosynthesis
MPLSILIIYDYFYPAQKAGGITRSLYNLCNILENKVNISVVCSCYDHQSSQIMQSIAPHRWLKLSENITIYYANPNNINFIFWKKKITDKKFDIIYINGIFSYKFNILPLIVLKFNPLPSRTIVAPHGMLQRGAIQSKKFKKDIFFCVTKWVGLFTRVQWHATDNQEATDIQSIYVNIKKIWIVPNIPNLYFQSSPFTTLPSVKERMQLKITTISLIAEKKNHKFAIQLFSKISQNLKIFYTIYGPIKDEAYWQSCQEMMCNVPGNIHIEYCGMLAPEDVERALAQHHFFLLPTQGENFGHAIFEAMSAGLPVIISDQTPWRNLEAQKVGWDIPLSEPERFVAAIERAARMDQAEYEQWSKAAHQYATDFVAKSNLKERYLEMFSAT